MAQLAATGYFDEEGDAHALTRWEISQSDPLFGAGNIVFAEESSSLLTGIVVPSLVLDPDTLYYWRAKFFDGECWSEYSSVFAFTTTVNGPAFIDGVDSDDIITGKVKLGSLFTDLNGNPINSPTVKCMTSKINPNRQIGIIVQGAEIIACRSRNPDDFDSGGLPLPDFTYGMVELELAVPNPGDVAFVTYYFDKPVAKDMVWWKYDPNIGFYDYAASTPNQVVSVSADRKSVTIMLKDGGYGDLIKLPDARIIDPAGPSKVRSGGGGDDNCFIRTLNFLK